ncbi:MAG TPA: aconitate hydratase AcnA [Acidimicrobiales bacterium]|nr:aconitate hydratase AcnA [Acidimicrobiales bacterium]
MTNSFNAHDQINIDDTSYDYFNLERVEGSHRLPYSLKVLLENLLRHEDGRHVSAEQISALAQWDPEAPAGGEIQFSPARVLLQDFTGVPCVVDLVAMRDAMASMGGDPRTINPLIPVELVIDHSVIADVAGKSDAFRVNADLEFARNKERYELLRWAQQSFDNFKVVPPDTGICHQVNLEYLARVVVAQEGIAYPDTLIGTDSHTTMINGLGVLGWGVGGIEAEVAMLGHPVSMPIPQVLGLKLIGELREGTTATDLVLRVAELLRQHGVVGQFVEFFGPGVASVPLANRATLGNMSPEYGSTCAIFPIDDETLRYLRLTGRADEHVRLVEAYAKQQGLWHDPQDEPVYSQRLELDLASVEASIAGPRRPQDRIALGSVPRVLSHQFAAKSGATHTGLDEASEESFPASDPIALSRSDVSDRPAERPTANTPTPWPSNPAPVTFDNGVSASLDHGDVVIAAITSCTNTSNPSVMIGAGLLAKKAVERGLSSQPWVKTSLAPGSRVVTEYLNRAGLTPYLEQLGFQLVGYGCTTCIGNSGPLSDAVSAAVSAHDLTVCSVLSGNRNFEGRIHAKCKMNFLASPPLVIAYALAGRMRTDLLSEPLGHDPQGEPVYLRDIWPSSREIDDVMSECVAADMFSESYADVFTGDDNWRSLDVANGDTFVWNESSTYVRRPPFFDGLTRTPAPVSDITGARVLAMLGDSTTTDHISPAGTIKADSAAGRYLIDHGVTPEQFNSYGSRRGNHEVMIRGTFANIRLRNLLVPDVVGSVTRLLPDGKQMSIYDAAQTYQQRGVPLIVIAGSEYGSGSSRDWAAKGTLLLGVRAVLATSYERIHRSNLVGMGVLPLEFVPGDSRETLGLTGEETYSITGLEGDDVPLATSVTVIAEREGHRREFEARVRIDTLSEVAYFRHGGVLPYVLRQLLEDSDTPHAEDN